MWIGHTFAGLGSDNHFKPNTLQHEHHFSDLGSGFAVFNFSDKAGIEFGVGMEVGLTQPQFGTRFSGNQA